MKRLALALSLGLLAFGGPAKADLCTIDAVPAATLLLPYFEVDYTNPDGVTTLFSLNNASATAILTHITLWTNWSQPTVDFDVYLTGFDVVTVNMRDIFNGNIPITASAGQDPNDTISPQGPISQDINFASCNNFFPFFINPVIRGANLERVRFGHTGKPVPSLGTNRCLGDDLGDNVGRGYITIDTVNQCSTAFAFDPGYFVDGGAGIATAQNVLWGDYFIVNPGENFALGDNLVHVEANGLFNATSTPTGYTFYGRYTAPTGGDNREPLGTTWATRYLNGGGFTGGTDLLVWRDSTANNQPNNGFSCTGNPDWFPLNEWEVIAFDEEEDAVEICFAGPGGVISPPDPGTDAACFPWETGRYAWGEGNLAVPYNFGWAYLNLNLPLDAPTGDVDFGTSTFIAQSYVTTSSSASGRFQVGYPAIALTSACEDVNPELNAGGAIPAYVPGAP
jgi:hypothetical protein